MPHTIEVPALNEDTFAKRLAGETGSRPALSAAAIATLSVAPIEAGVPEQAMPGAEPPKPAPVIAPDAAVTSKDTPAVAPAAAPRQADRSGPFDVTADSLPPVTSEVRRHSLRHLHSRLRQQHPPNPRLPDRHERVRDALPPRSPPAVRKSRHLATTITSPQDAIMPPAATGPARSASIDPPDRHGRSGQSRARRERRLENFLGERDSRPAARHQAAGARSAGFARNWCSSSR
jgi:hypothetical protein